MKNNVAFLCTFSVAIMLLLSSVSCGSDSNLNIGINLYGDLRQNWSRAVQGLRESDNLINYYGVTATSDGWVFQGEYYSKNTNGLLSVLINPTSGEMIQNNNLVIGIGKTNSIIGYNTISGMPVLKCVSTKNITDIWSSNEVTKPFSLYEIYDVGNQVVQYNKESSLLTSYETNDGRIAWERTLEYGDDVYLTKLQSGKHLLVSTENDNSKVSIIDNDGKTVLENEFKFFIGSICTTASHIWIERHYDDGTCVVPLAINQDLVDIEGNNELCDYWVIGGFDKGLLLCNKEEDKNNINYFVLLDSDMSIRKINGYSEIVLVNDSIIGRMDYSIQSLNPETLEPIWWIDLEKEDLGDNPRVIWCDWRGVLVMSDTKLACFTE